MSLDFSIDQLAGWLATGVPYMYGFLIVAFLVLGGILDYHWRQYGAGLIRLFQFRILYLSAGIIFIGVMTVAYLSL
jgi:hypothetical protein